jgi:hypothetical protein
MALAELMSQSGLSDEDKKTLTNIIYAEAAGGTTAEIEAVASTFLNLIDKYGKEKAFNRSSAYKKKSDQFKKASSGELNLFEQKVHQSIYSSVDGLITGDVKRQPWTNFENIKAFGEPEWSKGVNDFEDIGRQRFYILKNP